MRDNIPSRTYPIVNVSLIVVNLAVFIYQLSLGGLQDRFIYTHATIPAQFVAVGLTADQLMRLTVSMFLHGGWFHVLSNMLYLWVFGDNVEDRIGHFKYLIFYLLTGYIATITHILYLPQSKTPLIGASGAIAGILGAYLILYPRAMVLTLVIFFIVPIPAIIFLGIWFVMQIMSGTASLSAQSVAFWAHVGGFVAGMLMVKVFAGKEDPRYKY